LSVWIRIDFRQPLGRALPSPVVWQQQQQEQLETESVARSMVITDMPWFYRLEKVCRASMHCQWDQATSGPPRLAHPRPLEAYYL